MPVRRYLPARYLNVLHAWRREASGTLAICTGHSMGNHANWGSGLVPSCCPLQATLPCGSLAIPPSTSVRDECQLSACSPIVFASHFQLLPLICFVYFYVIDPPLAELLTHFSRQRYDFSVSHG